MAKGYWINRFRSIKDPEKVEAYRNLAKESKCPPLPTPSG